MWKGRKNPANPTLARKLNEFQEANVTAWRMFSPYREFMNMDDLADALVFLMKEYEEEEFINVGYGDEITIKDLAHLLKDVVDFEGELVFDSSRPDGTPRKLMDSGRLRAIGWEPSIDLRKGLEMTYAWYLENRSVIN